MNFIGLLLLLLSSSSLIAQDYSSLQGRILDEFSGDPVEFARLNLQIEGASVAQINANVSGDYSFQNIEGGYYDLVIQKSGFSPIKITNILVNPNENLEFNPAFEGEGYDADTIVFTFAEMHHSHRPTQHTTVQRTPSKRQKMVARKIP